MVASAARPSRLGLRLLVTFVPNDRCLAGVAYSLSGRAGDGLSMHASSCSRPGLKRVKTAGERGTAGSDEETPPALAHAALGGHAGGEAAALGARRGSTGDAAGGWVARAAADHTKRRASTLARVMALSWASEVGDRGPGCGRGAMAMRATARRRRAWAAALLDADAAAPSADEAGSCWLCGVWMPASRAATRASNVDAAGVSVAARVIGVCLASPGPCSAAARVPGLGHMSCGCALPPNSRWSPRQPRAQP